MSVAELRKKVKKHIDNADERVLKMIDAMLVADQEEDWHDALPNEAKLSIQKGLEDIKQGKIVPHEIVMKKYEKWLTK